MVTDTPLPARPPVGEVAWQLLSGVPGPRQAPDDLTRYKGPEVYRKMLRDPQVRALYDLTVAITLSREHRFELSDPADTRQQECERFLRWNLTRALRGTWRDALEGVLLAKVHGHSLTEKVFAPATWEGKARWIVRALKPRDVRSFTYTEDVHGNLIRLDQAQGARLVEIDRARLIHHVNRPAWDPVYGESDLRAAFRPWWEKDRLLAMWNIRGERLAGGLVVAKVKKALPPGQEADLQKAVSTLTAESSILLPDGVELEFHETRGSSEYEAMLAFRNKEIGKALLVPNLLGFSEQGDTGSRALGDTQLDLFFQVVQLQSDALADTLNEQLFRELAWWNFGLEDPPLFAYAPFTEAQRARIAKRWQEALAGGAVKGTIGDENRVRELLGFDPREEDPEEPVAAPAEEEMPPGEGDEEPPMGDEQMAPDEGAAPTRKERAARREGVSAAAPTPAPWRTRVDFQGAERALNAEDEGLGRALTKALAAMAAEARAAVEKTLAAVDAKIDVAAAVAALDAAVTADTRRALRGALRTGLAAAYDRGRQSALAEMERAGATGTPETQARVRVAAALTVRRAARGDAWTVAQFVSGIDMQTAEEYFAAKSFQLAGNLSQEVVDAAKQIILNGIRDERSIPDLREQLDELLRPYLAAEGVNVAQRAETIARTNVMEAFQQARLAVYADPGMGDFVEALEYSAILDDRTTPFCRAADGRVYPRGDAVWSRITPPNHFNCRSLLIPVTALDDWDASAPLPDSVEPAPGFRAGGA